MAKTSMINRETKRAKLAKQHAGKREALKKIISLRKKDAQERMEEDLILDTYLAALGMIEGPIDEKGGEA